MEQQAETSSYALLRDSQRASWVLLFSANDWLRLCPPPGPNDCRAQPVRHRRPALLAPIVVLVLTIVSATLVHALR